MGFLISEENLSKGAYDVVVKVVTDWIFTAQIAIFVMLSYYRNAHKKWHMNLVRNVFPTKKDFVDQG